MSGFGKELETKNIETKLYHSCTIQGLIDLYQNFDKDISISFSTDASKCLFGRSIVVVLKRDEYKGEYTPFDADSGRNHGYDEFRVSFNSFSEIYDRIESVKMTQETLDEIRIAETKENPTEDDEYIWNFFENMIGSHIEVVADEKEKKFYNF